jgi:N utilization substance protein B
MRVRHQARVVALQALFEIDCTGHAPAVVIDQRLGYSELPENGQQFAHELTKGVSENRDLLDEYIARYAPAWPVDQIAVIDRNVLRLAVYEIVIGKDTPIKVAINEAVELAKDFGSDSSGRFVNGVLGTLVSKETAVAKR